MENLIVIAICEGKKDALFIDMVAKGLGLRTSRLEERVLGYQNLQKEMGTISTIKDAIELPDVIIFPAGGTPNIRKYLHRVINHVISIHSRIRGYLFKILVLIDQNAVNIPSRQRAMRIINEAMKELHSYWRGLQFEIKESSTPDRDNYVDRIISRKGRQYAETRIRIIVVNSDAGSFDNFLDNILKQKGYIPNKLEEEEQITKVVKILEKSHLKPSWYQRLKEYLLDPP